MEQTSKQAYMESYDYKIVFILSKLRRVAALSGDTIPDQMNMALSESLTPKDYVYDKSFLILVEAGFIQLNEKVINIYLEYIANAYRYDLAKFDSAIKYEAMRLELSEDDVKNNRASIKAMYGIIEAMTK